MFFYIELNSESISKISNIASSLKMNPIYSTYTIEVSPYDGMHAIKISNMGQRINLFIFYPDLSGDIASIAIYGANLRGHLSAILSSMTIFGLPVESANMDGGMEDFVDVYLK